MTQQWAAAERRGNTPVLERMLADDFAGVGPRGFVLTKEQWLARYTSGDLHNESFDLDQLEVRLYGEVGVITGRQSQRARYQGHEANGQFRITLVAVQQEGHWRLSHCQLSGPLPDIPPRRG